jgi:hypothetical protein
MLVRCLVNTGVPTQEHGLWFSAKTKFHLTVGTDYPVHGVAVFKRGVIVLLLDDTGKPNWHPIELFEVTDGTLRPGWKFATRDDGDQGMQAIFGYPELVDDEGHKDALIERDPEALRIFQAQAGQ